MRPHRTYQAVRIEQGNSQPTNDELVVEVPLEIVINGNAWTMTMQSPGNELELVRGLLFSEDIYRNKEIAPEMELHFNDKAQRSLVHVTIQKDELKEGFSNSAQLLSVSSCGICGRTEMKNLTGDPFAETDFSSADLRSYFSSMRQHQLLFDETGGCHGIGAFDRNRKLLLVREDIGRHNAVDKVIGALLDSGELKTAHVLTVSGRVSFEIIAKAFMAGIPVVASVSAPSSLAVDLAKEFGMKLIGFCREDRLTVYS